MATILQMVANLDAGSMAKTVEAMQVQADRLGKTLGSYTAKVDDKAAQASILKMTMRADRLQDKLDTDLSISGVQKAAMQLLALEGQADRLDKKLSGAGSGNRLDEKLSGAGSGKRGFLGGLIRGLGGFGAGAGAVIPGVSGGGGAAAEAAPVAAAAGGVTTIAAALAALPFVAQAAAGGIVTALGGGMIGLGVLAASRLKPVKSAFADLSADASKQFAGLATPFGKALTDVLRTADKTLPLIVAPLKGALTTLAGPFKTFTDSLIKAFAQPAVATSLQDVAKAFGAILKALAPQLGTDIKDVAVGIERIANAVRQNPGVFAAIISFFFKAAGFALSMVAALTSVANYIEKHFIPALNDIRKAWDVVRHETAVIFDGIRHDVAHVWDQIFENTIGTVIRLGHNVETQFNSLRHGIADIYDGARRDIASIWDTIWRNTVGRVQRGVADVNGWFHRLPGMILRALDGLGTDLYNFAHMAMSKMWNGMKNVFGDVWGWFKSLPGKLLNAIGIHSPPDWAIEAGKHIMGGLLHGITSRKDELLSKFQAMSQGMASVAGRYTGPTGGIPGMMRAMAAGYGWTGSQWNALYNVEMREAGFNPAARNPSSGAYGLAQFIQGPSEYYQYGGNPGTAAGQITGMLNYIRQRYGNPMAAWQHELSFGWYDRGGWLPPGLSLALNQTGRPERVGGDGGNTYNITVNVPPSANKADTGRVIVEHIREFERRSGPGWRK